MMARALRNDRANFDSRFQLPCPAAGDVQQAAEDAIYSVRIPSRLVTLPAQAKASYLFAAADRSTRAAWRNTSFTSSALIPLQNDCRVLGALQLGVAAERHERGLHQQTSLRSSSRGRVPESSTMRSALSRSWKLGRQLVSDRSAAVRRRAHRRATRGRRSSALSARIHHLS
jgi:hypothetical protein